MRARSTLDWLQSNNISCCATAKCKHFVVAEWNSVTRWRLPVTTENADCIKRCCARAKQVRLLRLISPLGYKPAAVALSKSLPGCLICLLTNACRGALWRLRLIER